MKKRQQPQNEVKELSGREVLRRELDEERKQMRLDMVKKGKAVK